jgi:hypothetical protein
MSRLAAIEGQYDKSTKSDKNYSVVDWRKAERLGIGKYIIKNKDNFLRIIPPLDPDAFFGMEVLEHSNIGPDSQTYLCLKTLSMDCPICKAREALIEKNTEDARAEELRPSKRYLFFVFDTTDDKSQGEGLKWMDAPATVCNELVKLSRDKRTKQVIDISDPKTGCDVEFSREGKGRMTKYGSFKLARPSEIPGEWYKDVPDFLDILAIPSVEQLEKEMESVLDWVGKNGFKEDREEKRETVRETAAPATTETQVTRRTVTRAAPDGSDGASPAAEPAKAVAEPAKQETKVETPPPTTTTVPEDRKAAIAAKLAAAKAKARGGA